MTMQVFVFSVRTNLHVFVCTLTVFFFLREGELRPGWEGGGGYSHLDEPGMLIRGFELDPKGDQFRCGSDLM